MRSELESRSAMMLQPETDVADFEKKLQKVVVDNVGPEIQKLLGVTINQFLANGGAYSFHLQPFSSIYLYSQHDYGIDLNTGCNNNILTLNNVYGNTNNGIYLFSSSNNNTLTSNNAYSNHPGPGIYLLNSCINNTLTSNNVYSNWYGIDVDHSSINNTLASNNAYGNNNHGIILESNSNNNTLASNNTFSNGLYGIQFFNNANNNTVIANSVYSNTSNGILSALTTGNRQWLTSKSAKLAPF